MKSVSFSFLLVSILASFPLSAQKLKKADRSIVSNIQTHVNFLVGGSRGDTKTDSDAEKITADYIRKNFEHFGLRPKGDPDSWFQSFEIYEGKDVLPSSYLNINNHNLLLYTDYFPFSFSADKKAEGSVAIALSESGYPWFKDISDIVDDGHATGGNIGKLVLSKAKQAASKGATALIIYNTSQKDLSFDPFDSSAVTSIPVLYITKDAFKKYCKDESAMVDVKLNIAMQTKKRKTANVLGYIDNTADSTVILETQMADKNNIAAMIEVARLSRNIQPKKKNYLFIAYAEEQHGKNGLSYFLKHSTINLDKVNYTLNLDSMRYAEAGLTDLALVKKSIDLLKK